MVREAKVRLDSIFPLVHQLLPSDSLDIDTPEGSRDGVKTSRIDDDIKLKVFVFSLDAAFMNVLDRVLVDVHKLYIGLIEGLVIATLEWDSACSETVILGDEFLGDGRIVHTLTDLLGNEFREKLVCCLVGVDVVEVGEPFREAGLRVE